MRILSILIVSLLSIINSRAQSLVFNEVCVRNQNIIFDEDDKPSSWIELYNTSGNGINLNAYYLSDDPANLQKYQLPNFILTGNNRALVYLSGKTSGVTEIHTPFRWKASEILYLSNSTGLISQLAYPASSKLNTSFLRNTDGGANWGYTAVPTPNGANQPSTWKSCISPKPIIQDSVALYNGNSTVQITNPNNALYAAPYQDKSSITQGYFSPLVVNPVNFNNNLSTIATNPSFNYPINDYTAVRANNRGWLNPYADVENINTFAFTNNQTGCLTSEVAYVSLIDQSILELPILSIHIDSSDIFGQDDGIYVYGNGSSGEGNYQAEGFLAERPANVELIDENGVRVLNEPVGLRIAGNGSRHSTQKNLKIYFRDTYGKDELNLPLFPDSKVKTFETLQIRGAGHRPDCWPRDELAARLVEQVTDYAGKFIYTKIFVNGEYWGIHALKERLDEDFLSQKFDSKKDNFALYKNNGTMIEGDDQDSLVYDHFIEFTTQNDLNIAANLDTVFSYMDVEDYFDYMSSQIFTGNGDWPNSNIKFWRFKGGVGSQPVEDLDGKFRYLFFDLDGGFGGTCADVFKGINNFERATDTTAAYKSYTQLFRNILTSDSLKHKFIHHTCDHLNSHFLSSVTVPKLNEITNVLNLEMLDHIERWRYPSTSVTLADRATEVPNLNQWNYIQDKLEEYLILRPATMRRQLQTFFSLADSSLLTVDVNDATQGYVTLNSISITDDLEGVAPTAYPWNGWYFDSIPLTITAKPMPGYIFVEWLETGNTNSTLHPILIGDSTFTAIFETDPNYTGELPLVINEIQSSNTHTVTDDFNENEDWIEIYNPNNFEVNLNGYFLSDDINVPLKYFVNQNLYVPASGHLVFWCDDESDQGILHTNFKLAAGGETAVLTGPDSVLVDMITFPSMLSNTSYGRASDGANSWIVFTYPTPHLSNQLSEIITKDVNQTYVYPNPLNSNVLNISKTLSGYITDISGNIVMDFTDSESINVSQLSAGIYNLVSSEGEYIKWVKL